MQGDYVNFEKVRAENLRAQKKAHDAQVKQQTEIKAFINRFKDNEGLAGLVQSRKKQLEKTEQVRIWI